MSRRRKVTTEASSSKNEPKNKAEVVSYQAFFQGCLHRGLVKPWQEREINAFFKDLGLTDKEPEDRYKDALEKY